MRKNQGLFGKGLNEEFLFDRLETIVREEASYPKFSRLPTMFLLQGRYNLGYVEKRVDFEFPLWMLLTFYETTKLKSCPKFYNNLKG